MTTLAIADGLRIAVLLPCYNEALTIAAVVRGFAEALPGAAIYVFDNNSTDDTARAAGRAGARVFRELRPGKGNVVRRMFADVEADIYVMAEGDGSYDPADAPSLINALVTEHVDMVVGTRRDVLLDAGRSSRAFGGGGLKALNRWVSGQSLGDIGSGYRAFTRRFVKSFPAISTGLGIETEMSVHASQLMIPVAEIDLNEAGASEGYAFRKTANREGAGGLHTALLLMRETRPFVFYCAFAMLFWTAGLILILPILAGWLQTGLAPSPFSTVISTGLIVSGFVLAASGLVLDSLSRSRIEQKRILFLTVPALGQQ
jgi:glycosyltransferase involved in cell wall biosynthesis